jgi:FtsH-binding integral membrane protein
MFGMIGLFSVFIVYDIQWIVGGRYEELCYGDYVIASVLLFADILGIFVLVLYLCGRMKSNARRMGN